MEQRVESITLEEFLDWEERQEQKHELLHGRIVAFSGASFDHNHIVYNVQTVLNSSLESPCFAYGTDIIIETAARRGTTVPSGYRRHLFNGR